MKTLVVEDDFTNRLLLQEFLTLYGECHIAVTGQEAIDAFILAKKNNNPYDLICMDIMLPGVDGHEALKQIREQEKNCNIYGSKEVKVLMISALNDPHNVMEAYYQGGANAYMVKPIDIAKLLEHLYSFGLVK
jgi:two-component system, chemotaxis family, chemotaxis protein CheY